MLAGPLAALWVAPAVAASPQPFALADWVKSNTDLPVAQVAIAGPDNVYSVEPIGPRLPTGELLVLVRTEAIGDDWGAAHRFQSWDAHMLFDCQGGRVRVLRSTSYAERDRRGPAKADSRGDEWFSPTTDTPAATLLAAACDATFAWPLRDAAGQVADVQVELASSKVRAARWTATISSLPAPLEARRDTVSPAPSARLAAVAMLDHPIPTFVAPASAEPPAAMPRASADRSGPTVLATYRRLADAARDWARERGEAATAHSDGDASRARSAQAASDNGAS